MIADMRTLCTLLLAGSPILLGQPDARQIVTRSIAVADRSWAARKSYLYLERYVAHPVDSERRITSTDVRVSKAVLVNGGTIDQVISHNGKPPAPEQIKKDQEL